MKELKSYKDFEPELNENISDSEHNNLVSDLLVNLDNMTPDEVGDINKSINGNVYDRNRLYKTHKKFAKKFPNIDEKIKKRKETKRLLNKLKSNELLNNDDTLDMIHKFVTDLTNQIKK
jgi:hypothetical protein